MDSLLSVAASRLPDQIMTDWRRFSCGLWRMPEGDIAAAYCADTFPTLKVFTHEGRLFTNGGACHGGLFDSSADCYPLVPAEDYEGPEAARFTWEGREARFQCRVHRLGRKVHFVACAPAVAECQRLLRVMYVDGGWFARFETYGRFLAESCSDQKTETGRDAVRLEASGEFAAFTKDDLRRVLEGPTEPRVSTLQLDFAL
jgi:hypothetical protein